jgi:hypothetical protein
VHGGAVARQEVARVAPEANVSFRARRAGRSPIVVPHSYESIRIACLIRIGQEFISEVADPTSGWYQGELTPLGHSGPRERANGCDGRLLALREVSRRQGDRRRRSDSAGRRIRQAVRMFL